MGAEPRRLGIPGEIELSGCGVSTCGVCDGAFFKDQKVIVIGGGDSAMEDSIFISKFASELTVVNRRDEFRASKIMEDRAREQANIDFKTPFVAEEFVAGDKGRLDHVRLRNAETGETEDFEADGAFIAIGHIPRSEVVTGQVDTDEDGYIVTEPARPAPTWPASSPSATSSTTPTARRSPPPAPAAWAPSTPSGTCATRRPRPRPTGCPAASRSRSPRRRPALGVLALVDQLSGPRRCASPRGVSISIGLPTLALSRARPIGDSAERRPSARLASVEPTRVQVLTSPLASSSTSAVRPKAKVSAFVVDLDHDRGAQPLAQSLDLGLEMGLVLLGDVVLGVLLEVAFLARDLDPRRHLRPRRPFELLDFLAQGLDALLGDRLPAWFGVAHCPSLSDVGGPLRAARRSDPAIVGSRPPARTSARSRSSTRRLRSPAARSA